MPRSMALLWRMVLLASVADEVKNISPIDEPMVRATFFLASSIMDLLTLP